MKKLILIISMVAMLTVAAIPALANTFQEQEAESGDVVQSFDSSVFGYGNATANNANFDANTGNFQSQESYTFSGSVQYDNADY